MGKETEGDRRSIGQGETEQWKPFEGVMRDAEQAIASRYELPLTAELYDLLDKLKAYGTRDLINEWSSDKFIELRQSASTDLAAIISAAEEVRNSVAYSDKLIGQFENTYEYSPVLMEAVADVCMGEPGELFPENELNALGRFLRQQSAREPFLTNVDAIRSMPIWPSAIRGRVPHTTLKRAVADIRTFWQQAGRGWTADVLQSTDDWKVAHLETQAERFLVDVLRVTGFDFGPDLGQLRTAWKNRKQQGH